MSQKVLIVVPFYRNLRLIEIISDNLSSLATELNACNAQCIFVNDSPDFPGMSETIDKCVNKLLKAGLLCNQHRNDENYGFIYSANVGIGLSVQHDAHCLLLNSDAQLAPGALTEMLEVLKQDPCIAIVNPRSNNATICSLPFERRTRAVNFENSYKDFQKLSSFLPRWNFLPTGVGFCFLMRADIIKDYGVLDPVYGKGYNEENDFCMRINRCGFRVAVANRAFVYHESNTSFGQEETTVYEQRNRPLLLSRYPEYEKMVQAYFEGSDFIFEQGLSVLLDREEKCLSIAVDLSHIRNDHTGTAEYGIRFLHALVKSESRDFRVACIMRPIPAEFHRIEWLLPEVEIVDPDTDEFYYDVVIKPAQPFTFRDLQNLSKWGLYNFVTMLDTIALDCGYIFNGEVAAVWDLAGRACDGMLFISDFSKEQYQRRFKDSLSTPQLGCLLSTDVKDYLEDPRSSKDKEIEGAVDTSVLPKGKYVFIVGNHFEHKYVKPTLDKLSSEFPVTQFLAMGRIHSEEPNVKIVPSGNLSHATIDAIYDNAEFIVFPSQYEGFGFPILHALARNKTIIARASTLNDDIKSRWNGGGKLILYKTNDELVEIIKNIKSAELTNNEQSLAEQKTWGWKENAEASVNFMKEVVRKDPELKRRKLRASLYSMIHPFGIPREKWDEKCKELDRKEAERIALADELHERNLAYLALLDEKRNMQNRGLYIEGGNSRNN